MAKSFLDSIYSTKKSGVYGESKPKVKKNNPDKLREAKNLSKLPDSKATRKDYIDQYKKDHLKKIKKMAKDTGAKFTDNTKPKEKSRSKLKPKIPPQIMGSKGKYGFKSSYPLHGTPTSVTKAKPKVKAKVKSKPKAKAKAEPRKPKAYIVLGKDGGTKMVPIKYGKDGKPDPKQKAKLKSGRTYDSKKAGKRSPSK